ncbi:PucR family transcriptional regulator [Mycobacteroides abscessus]|uniref:PucR family transcriptional regulator n=1 Tax=Mycobacteroides abscessus TaxID=36809 RepID=UPI00092BA3F1|nr:helix-turn-helix domain-containing protein [Mycobacteroides abscessus]SHQ89498.1 transcriptional regulatory protein [Mycobacteroides abscessus subsp. bolletii]SHR73498.1 transcriptional regulatory protein [Mycobacteroides abscessus subsp. bolletii]SHT16821.1 transcriptional regulatory protein [Mycobacteroides abscessus subsp. bolletii]SKG06365.1 transcriptional regulatory protein [Mycobacteroides abscessus subsp. bolletii]SKG72906.1 transcriptional regulatory protein [Mycobacteroides absces
MGDVLNLRASTRNPMARRSWERPTRRIAQLIQHVISTYLNDPQEFYRVVESEALAAASSSLNEHPHLVDDIRASIRSITAHWVASNIRRPGEPVVVSLTAQGSPEFTHDIINHDWELALPEIFKSAQRAMLGVWTNLAFELTTDPTDLRDYLTVITRSIFAYWDDVAVAQGSVAKSQSTSVPHLDDIRRLKAVKQLLKGDSAEDSAHLDPLGYSLGAQHTAVIVWTESSQAVAFDDAISSVIRLSGAASSLVVSAGPTVRWIWLSTATEVDVATLSCDIEETPNIRVAIGSSAPGAAGFRRTHLQAMSTQRLMRHFLREIQVASHHELDVISLVLDNEQQARDFAQRNLGKLASASCELRETLRTYLREGSNVTRTAELLYTHRNTIVNRLDKIQALLPVPLEGNILKVGLALEISQVLGGPSETGTTGTRV